MEQRSAHSSLAHPSEELGKGKAQRSPQQSKRHATPKRRGYPSQGKIDPLRSGTSSTTGPSLPSSQPSDASSFQTNHPADPLQYAQDLMVRSPARSSPSRPCGPSQSAAQRAVVSPPPQRFWQRQICYTCGRSIRSEQDMVAHLNSKEHLKKMKAKEQSAVIVLGLPPDASMELVRLLFKDFHLQPNAISFVPSTGYQLADADTPSSSSEAPPGEAFWHVQFNNVDDARRAVKMPSLMLDNQPIIIAPALSPHRCTICRTTLNSAAQLAQHMSGARHKQLLEKHTAECTLTVIGIPSVAKEGDIQNLFAACQILEGGIILVPDVHIVDAALPTCTAYVTFPSKQEALHALRLLPIDPRVKGVRVDVVRTASPCPPKAEVPQVSVAGLKTPEEVQLLVHSLLYAHHVTDVNELGPALLNRIYSTFLSSRPASLPGSVPRNRFFHEFDAQAGGKQGMVTMETTLAILKPIEFDFPFCMPDGVSEWLMGRILKLCNNSEDTPVNKSLFVQIRNLKCHAYQMLGQMMQMIMLNRLRPPLLVHQPQPHPPAQASDPSK